MIALVTAMDELGQIGLHNTMPWHCSEDLALFKEITLHHVIVFGRKTWEGMNRRILPKRKTIIVSRDPGLSFNHKDVEICHDLKQLLIQWKSLPETLYICGGAMIYEEALPFADELHISRIHGIYEADRVFPFWDETAFTLIEKKEFASFTYFHYEK